MDEMLLNELYGSEEARQDEEVKLAQAELVEAVAAEAGVDLNELDDEELEKFAHYVLSDEDELNDNQLTDDSAIMKIAEAEVMGRTMARAYADEMQQISNGGNEMNKVASAMQDVAEAWQMQKWAAEEGAKETAGEAAEKEKEKMGDRAKRYLKNVGDFTGFNEVEGRSLTNRNLRRGGTVAAGLGVLGGGYHLATRKKKNQKKTASYADWMFEKLAEPEGGDSKDKEAFGDMLKRRGRELGEFTGVLGLGEGVEDTRKVGRKTRAGLTSTALVGAGLGARHLMKKRKKNSQEKRASLMLANGYEALAYAELHSPEEFAKEAELRAAEALAANGIHPETFEEIEPQEIKLASFPGVQHAADEHEAIALAEYNEMLDTAAEHIIESLFED